MLLEHNKRILIFLLSSIGLITFPHVWHLPAAILAFFSILLMWRFIGIWKPQWLPHKLIVLLLLLGSIPLLLSQYRGFLGRDAGTSLFVIALSLKLLEIRKERDLYLICYLAFIVASSQFLFEQSIFMAAYILFVCCVLLTTMIFINSPQPQTLAAFKKSAIILIQAIPIAVVLFLLFPRIEAPRWTWFKDSSKAKTGLGETMEPGSISNLGMSAELVFRAKFKNNDIPPKTQLYWRGVVYSHTDGKRWSRSKGYSYKPYMDTPIFEGKSYEYTLLMEPQQKNWVFTLEMPSKYSKPLYNTQTYQLHTRSNPDSRNEYQIVSHPQYNTGYITKGEFQQNTQLPGEPSTRIVQLVEKLNGFKGKPQDFIYALLRHFATEEFHYTLMPPLMDKNPIETFLFENRYGFCSHYATAFVYLMRVANIPARVVAGYQGGQINKVGKFIEVRQANAHSWAEVWLDGKGWTRFDPTSAVAPARIEQGIDVDQQISAGEVNFASAVIQDIGWLQEAEQLWQSLDYNWQRWVIHYNTDNQARFLSKLGIAGFKSMVYWMVAFVALLVLCLAAYLFKGNQDSSDKAKRLYQQFCDKLARLDCERQTGETSGNFALRATKRFPEYQQAITHITDLYQQQRYGRHPSTELLAQLQQAVKKFKISLKP